MRIDMDTEAFIKEFGHPDLPTYIWLGQYKTLYDAWLGMPRIRQKSYVG